MKCKYPSMPQVKSKVWIEVEGEPVFGRGRRFLLDAIDRYGSINQAAKRIGVSYRRAWSYIKAMEYRLGIKLVHRKAGGRNGGGARLTDEAREFLRLYSLLEDEVRRFTDKKFKEIFKIKDDQVTSADRQLLNTSK